MPRDFTLKSFDTLLTLGTKATLIGEKKGSGKGRWEGKKPNLTSSLLHARDFTLGVEC